MTEQLVNITDLARDHFRRQLKNEPNAIGIRLGIKNSGCAGKSYTIGFAYEANSQDHIIESEDVTFIIQLEDLKHLEGLELDLQQEGINGYLKFTNPNAVSECGCGESFQPKE